MKLECCNEVVPRTGLRARPIALGLLMGFLAAGSCGCGDATSDAGLFRVLGRVMYRGQPLSCGSVAFRPLGANGRGAVTMIQDGQYQLSAAEGLPEGRFGVAARRDDR
jgi:hypothetical protein